ncbi:hypothetical protein ASD64_17205 [Mesorhizobium sp. Root157]|nr:hypothetical protein ASD64_17205 [Mesorhizobium sp. Root157]
MAATVIGASPALAASSTCHQLEAQLARVSGSVSPKLVRKYDDAIVRQGKQIEIARRQASRAGCGFLLFDGSVGRCAEINSAIERMNTNLDSLHRKRAALSRNSDRQDRARIQAALDANDCRKQQVTIIRSSQPDNIGAEQARPNGTDAPAQSLNKGIIIRRSGDGFVRLGGEYRTLCVRTCDGYFFPMSSATPVGDFQRDQARCEAACPGTNVEMFYSEGGDDDRNMMSSITGDLYKQLPNAFVYKRLDIPREPSCSCGAIQDSPVVGGPQAAQPPQITSRPGSSIVEMGPAKPTASATPTKALSETVPAERDPDDDSKVRVVGPTFLPGPEEAIDLQAPARTRAP